MTNQDILLACNPLALPIVQRQKFDALTESLVAAALEMREHENGLSLRFANEPGRLKQIAEFIERESLCCPFLNFSLDIEPEQGPIWVKLTGPGGVKELLLAEMGIA